MVVVEVDVDVGTGVDGESSGRESCEGIDGWAKEADIVMPGCAGLVVSRRRTLYRTLYSYWTMHVLLTTSHTQQGSPTSDRADSSGSNSPRPPIVHPKFHLFDSLCWLFLYNKGRDPLHPLPLPVPLASTAAIPSSN